MGVKKIGGGSGFFCSNFPKICGVGFGKNLWGRGFLSGQGGRIGTKREQRVNGLALGGEQTVNGVNVGGTKGDQIGNKG